MGAAGPQGRSVVQLPRICRRYVPGEAGSMRALRAGVRPPLACRAGKPIGRAVRESRLVARRAQGGAISGGGDARRGSAVMVP